MVWLHALASWWLVGVGITVTLVHYPTFHDVAGEGFVAFHRRHSAGMTLVVAVPWLAQGISALWLLLGTYAFSTKLVAVASAVAVVLTVAVIVPAHARLSGGFDAAAFARLTVADRFRLVAFVGHALAATIVAYKSL